MTAENGRFNIIFWRKPMKEKARDLVYLETNRQTSYEKIRKFYLITIIIQLFMVIVGIASIKTNGVSIKTLLPLGLIGAWNLFFWIFVFMLQSKKTKKTFELRFLVNGICGLLTSSIFLCLYITISLAVDSPAFEPEFTIWIMLFYLMFSVIYIGLIVIGAHKGAFKKMREKTHTSAVLAIDAFLAAIVPLAGLLGIYTSRFLKEHASVGAQDMAAAVCFILLIFIPALAHINFVQYYYCKKYGIGCDESGDAASSKLERQYKEKKPK